MLIVHDTRIIKKVRRFWEILTHEKPKLPPMWKPIREILTHEQLIKTTKNNFIIMSNACEKPGQVSKSVGTTCEKS